MTATIDPSIQNFQNTVDSLYDNIKKWSEESQISHHTKKMMIHDGDLGEYEIDSLILKSRDEKTIAEFKPVGSRIIGADGRMDMYGTIDRQILAYLKPPGPRGKISETGERTQSNRYSGVEEAGWYWIESRIPSKARIMNQELFVDLLRVVSDYDNV